MKLLFLRHETAVSLAGNDRSLGNGQKSARQRTVVRTATNGNGMRRNGFFLLEVQNVEEAESAEERGKKKYFCVLLRSLPLQRSIPSSSIS